MERGFTAVLNPRDTCPVKDPLTDSLAGLAEAERSDLFRQAVGYLFSGAHIGVAGQSAYCGHVIPLFVIWLIGGSSKSNSYTIAVLIQAPCRSDSFPIAAQ